MAERVIIGRGNFGFVELLDREHKIAAKWIQRTWNEEEDEKLKREWLAMKRLSHSNIVQFYALTEIHEDVISYFVIKMEYCERKSLRQVINDTTIVYNQKTMICWAEHLFRALQCLQENHIVHRDLKPENVLVTGDFILKFCDFGCVRELNNTGTVTMIGTYRYMSPEMATKSWFTHQSDVYSIGLVLWEISEREVVYAEYGVRQFDHFTFFPDFQLGNVQLPSPHCDETLKQMILDCTVFDHTARPAIHKCLTQIDDLQKRYVDLDFSPLISPNRKCLLRLDQTTIADNNSQSSDIPFLSSIESPDESPSTEFEHKNESDFNRILRRSHEISDKLKKATVMPITKLMRENRLSHGGLRALRKKLDEDIIDMPVSDPLCEHRDFLLKTVFDYEFTFDSLPLFPEPVNENFLKFLLKSGLDTEVIEDLMTESITWYLLRIDDFKKYRATLIKCFRALSDFYETNDAELFREQIAAFQTAFKRNPWSGDIADSPTHLRLVVYKNEKTVPDAWYLLSRKESLFVRCDYSEFRKFSPFLESSKNLDNISFFDVESPNDPLRKVENRLLIHPSQPTYSHYCHYITKNFMIGSDQFLPAMHCSLERYEKNAKAFSLLEILRKFSHLYSKSTHSFDNYLFDLHATYDNVMVTAQMRKIDLYSNEQLNIEQLNNRSALQKVYSDFFWTIDREIANIKEIYHKLSRLESCRKNLCEWKQSAQYFYFLQTKKTGTLSEFILLTMPTWISNETNETDLIKCIDVMNGCITKRSFKYEQIDDENLARITVDRLLFVVEEFIGFMEKLVRRIDEAEENGFDPQKKLWESKADYPSMLQQRFCREVFPKIAA